MVWLFLFTPFFCGHEIINLITRKQTLFSEDHDLILRCTKNWAYYCRWSMCIPGVCLLRQDEVHGVNYTSLLTHLAHLNSVRRSPCHALLLQIIPEDARVLTLGKDWEIKWNMQLNQLTKTWRRKSSDNYVIFEIHLPRHSIQSLG